MSRFTPRTREWERIKAEMFVEGAICWLCGKPIIYGLRRNHPLGPSIDHLTPVTWGGHLTARENLVVAHFGCNSRRSNRAPKIERPRSRDY